jgi:DNA-binding transcriptional MocR family regulator
MKRIWKKALCVGMTAVMTAGTLSGCGKQEKELTTIRLNEVAHSIFYAPQYVAIEKGYFERHIKRLVNDYRGRREKICRMFRESRLNEISTIYQDDAGTHFLLHVKTSLSDVEIKWAVRQKGILINCLSEYCFADADKYHGILVIHYSDMDEATLKLVIAAFEEIFL